MFLGFHKSISTATASDRILKLLSLPPLAAQSKAVQPLMSPVLGSRPSSRRRLIVLVDSERLRDDNRYASEGIDSAYLLHISIAPQHTLSYRHRKPGIEQSSPEIGNHQMRLCRFRTEKNNRVISKSPF